MLDHSIRGYEILPLPSFLKTSECLFPLKSMQYPSIKSAISSALANENVVNTRGCKQKGDKKTVTYCTVGPNNLQLIFITHNEIKKLYYPVKTIQVLNDPHRFL